MNTEQALQTIKAALEKATLAGAFTLEDTSYIVPAIAALTPPQVEEPVTTEVSN